MFNRILLPLLCLIGLYVLNCNPSFAQVVFDEYSSLIRYNEITAQGHLIQAVNMTSLPKLIFRQWIHSREEDEGEMMVYRPVDYPFPPARGREGMEFRENGEFVRYQIGPTDRRQLVSGRWTLKEPDVAEVHFTDQPASSYMLIILECNEHVLKVKQRSGVSN